jgi:succinate dehydrogenase assembly factor 2
MLSKLKLCFSYQFALNLSRAEVARPWQRQLHTSGFMATQKGSSPPSDLEEEPPMFDAPENNEPPIPPYKAKTGESIDVFRSRLQYQSRKRGTLENGLLLSSFASRYLSKLTKNQLVQYDTLINKPTNDWDIYYWIVGTKPTPAEYENEVMDLLRDHAKNKGKEVRIMQPELFKS